MRGQCYVCGRWGVDLQMVSKSKGRHDECHPGTEIWLLWYMSHPEKHNLAGDIILAFHNKVKGG